jgi:hypothetical protein
MPSSSSIEAPASKYTSNGVVPLAGVAVNLATGGRLSGVSTLIVTLAAWLLPRLSVTVRVA